MSLSRRERRALNEIGRQLFTEDPEFAARLGRPPRSKHHGLLLTGAVLLTLAGFGLLMMGAVLRSTELGVAGFLIMAAAASSASRRISPPRFLRAGRPPNPEVRHNTSVE